MPMSGPPGFALKRATLGGTNIVECIVFTPTQQHYRHYQRHNNRAADTLVHPSLPPHADHLDRPTARDTTVRSPLTPASTRHTTTKPCRCRRTYGCRQTLHVSPHGERHASAPCRSGHARPRVEVLVIHAARYSRSALETLATCHRPERQMHCAPRNTVSRCYRAEQVQVSKGFWLPLVAQV